MERVAQIEKFQNQLMVHCISSTLISFGLATLGLVYLGKIFTLLVILAPLFFYWKFSVTYFNINKRRADLIGIKWNTNMEKLDVKDKSWTEYEAAIITLT